MRALHLLLSKKYYTDFALCWQYDITALHPRVVVLVVVFIALLAKFVHLCYDKEKGELPQGDYLFTKNNGTRNNR